MIYTPFGKCPSDMLWLSALVFAVRFMPFWVGVSKLPLAIWGRVEKGTEIKILNFLLWIRLKEAFI
jgi:hypothetical protein